jgi:hypothetical protein
MEGRKGESGIISFLYPLAVVLSEVTFFSMVQFLLKEPYMVPNFST